jgi:hypothetical protein
MTRAPNGAARTKAERRNSTSGCAEVPGMAAVRVRVRRCVRARRSTRRSADTQVRSGGRSAVQLHPKVIGSGFAESWPQEPVVSTPLAGAEGPRSHRVEATRARYQPEVYCARRAVTAGA